MSARPGITTPGAALVTGGAGFIGSELVAQLVAHGWHVTVLDDLSTGRRAHLADLPADRCRLVVGDVRERGLVARLVRDAPVVFHLACLGVRHSLAAPRENADVNAGGTLALLEAARAAGVARVVHVSSSEVYGSAVREPMDEDHPTAPTTVYGAAKLAGEAYARAFHALAARYGERLADVPRVEPPSEPAWARSNWQSYCVRLADDVDQRRVLAYLLAAGIAAKPGIMCAHREAAFPRTVWQCGHDLACDAGAPCPHLRESERRRDRRTHPAALPRHDRRRAGTRRGGAPRRVRGRQVNAFAVPPTTRHAPRLLSIVTPAHDEAANLPELHRRLEAALTSLDGAWEWIVVDDASTDGTSAVLAAMAATDSAVRPLHQPRRSGSHAAILAGCRAARGDAAVVLVADLQDPPEMIPGLLAEWRRGADVVWAARTRDERWTNGRSPFGAAYYSPMRYVAGLRDLPPYGADLVAIDGSVLEVLRQREHPPTSVLALIAAVGRVQTSIPSRRAPRARGRSGWTTAARVRLALASLGEFTVMRVRCAWRSG